MAVQLVSHPPAVQALLQVDSAEQLLVQAAPQSSEQVDSGRLHMRLQPSVQCLSHSASVHSDDSATVDAAPALPAPAKTVEAPAAGLAPPVVEVPAYDVLGLAEDPPVLITDDVPP